MSVVVQCYNCSNILELDEGFRGGVCRCSQCGSLLQVPKSSSAGAPPRARPAAPGARPSEPGRPVNPNADPGLSRGQFDPRSGMRPTRPDPAISSGAFAPSPNRPGGPRKIEKVKPVGPVSASAAIHQREVKKNATLLIVAIASVAIVLILGIIVLVLMMSGGEKSPPSSGGGSSANATHSGTGGTNPPAATPVGFFGVELTGRRIVFSIDAGGSMRDNYDFVARAVAHAVDQLQPGQEFRIALWRTPEPLAIPASWADKAARDQVRKELDNYSAQGGHDAAPNINKSLDLGGDQVIVITAKTGIGDDVAEQVIKHRKNQRIDTIWITSSPGDSPLKRIATTTGGTYLTRTPSEIESYYRK